MKNIFITLLLLILIIGGGGFLVYKKYGLLFAKTVEGRIVAIEPATDGFAIGVADAKGDIYPAKSLGEEWKITHKGQCIKAKFFPYPPWDLQNKGTYWGARILGLKECEGQTPEPVAPAAVESTTVPTQEPANNSVLGP